MEATYREILPKVCTNLVPDLLVRRKKCQAVDQYALLEKVQIFEKCRDHILNTTGMVPAIYERDSLCNTYEIDT